MNEEVKITECKYCGQIPKVECHKYVINNQKREYVLCFFLL